MPKIKKGNLVRYIQDTSRFDVDEEIAIRIRQTWRGIAISDILPDSYIRIYWYRGLYFYNNENHENVKFLTVVSGE